jgi:hypothetical protein
LRWVAGSTRTTVIRIARDVDMLVALPHEPYTAVTDCKPNGLRFRCCHEWWHHCGVILPHPRLRFASAVFLAAFLVACSSTHVNYRNDAPHKELLETLRQCLVEVPIRGQKNAEFVSPCVRLDVSPLNGIGRSRLIDAVGPPQFCTNQSQSSFPEKDDCPVDQNPQWHFYRRADPLVSGGGPELICEANKETHCVTVEWRRSQ